MNHRKSIRLKGYDYSQLGLYFITIATQGRKNLFGDITDDKMILNDVGIMVEKLWCEIPNDFKNTKLHEYIIMPNHFHGIIQITVGADSISAHCDTKNKIKTTIPNIMQSFKRHTTIQYIDGVKNKNWLQFKKRIWQRNYWEHIIRNEKSYQHISEYIVTNPQKWEDDKLNGRYNG